MISDLYIRSPKLTWLTLAVILIVGVSVFQSMPREEDPATTDRVATVTTLLPGADAERIEALITNVIELELQSINEIDEIASVSRAGISTTTVFIESKYDQEDVERIWAEVRNRLSAVRSRLHPDIVAPVLVEHTSTAVTLVVALTGAENQAASIDILSRLTKDLRDRLSILEGTRQIDLYGSADATIVVEVDPNAIAHLGVDLETVSQAIASADIKTPAGQIDVNGSRILVEFQNELRSLDEIRAIPLALLPSGSFLRLADFATVTRQVTEPRNSYAYAGPRESVVMAAFMEPGYRVDIWSANAKNVLNEFRSDLPASVRVDVIFDQSRYVDERMRTLFRNLGMSAVFVCLVLCVFMGGRSGIIIAAALPIVAALTLFGMNVLGVTLHQMSITGLIIALGMLIDNAIIVVDETIRDRDKTGGDFEESASRVSRTLWPPLGAATASTILAFLPIALMPGAAGEFVGPLSIGVCLALASSLFVSMTIIASLCRYRVIRAENYNGRATNASWLRNGLTLPTLENRYRSLVQRSLARPWIGIAIGVALPVIGFSLAGSLDQQFFPPTDRDQFQVQLALGRDAGIEQSAAVVRRAQARTDQHEGVKASYWFVGSNAPPVYYNMFSYLPGDPAYTGGFVVTESPEATARVLRTLQEDLRQSFPEARILTLPFEQGPPFAAPIEVRVFGHDIGELSRLGEELRRILADTMAVTYTDSTILGGMPTLTVNAAREATMLGGADAVGISNTVAANLDGSTNTFIREGKEIVPVYVRANSELRNSVNDVLTYPLYTRSGAGDARARGIALGSVATTALVPDTAVITRLDGERVNRVRAYLLPFSNIPASFRDFLRRLEADGLQAPPGYRFEIGGEDAERSGAQNSLALYALPLLVLLLGSVVLAHRTIRDAALILGVGLLSIGLAFFALTLFGLPFGFMGLVGAMGLFGLSINDSVIVLAKIREAVVCGHSPAVITERVFDATRHIVTTTATTITGFIPLLLFGGRFWTPLAAVFVGGIAGATLLALFTVPAAMMWLYARSRQSLAMPPAATAPS